MYVYIIYTYTQLYWSGKATKLYLSQHTAGGCRCCCLSCWVWGSCLKCGQNKIGKQWKRGLKGHSKHMRPLKTFMKRMKPVNHHAIAQPQICDPGRQRTSLQSGQGLQHLSCYADAEKASVKVWNLNTKNKIQRPEHFVFNHRFQAFESNPHLSPGCMPILPSDCWDLQGCSGSHSEAKRYRIRWWDGVCGLQFIVSCEILCSKSIKIYAIMCSYITGPDFSLSVPCSVGQACVEDLYWRWSFQ